jgi:selenocysteine lyase/cysteine desulfurase
MSQLRPYKLRPAPDSIPGRWMTGTQNHACIAGVTAAIDYMASLAESALPHDSPESSTARQTLADSARSSQLDAAFRMIESHEHALMTALIDGLCNMPSIKLFGIVDPVHFNARVPTVSFQVRGMDSATVAKKLGDQGIYVWHGNYYALPVTQALGTEPEGMVRMGCMHYNTLEEIARALDCVSRLTV